MESVTVTGRVRQRRQTVEHEDIAARCAEMLVQLQDARDPPATVPLIAGTTASLRGCIADGAFSERLFFRLNIIHVVGHGPLMEE